MKKGLAAFFAALLLLGAASLVMADDGDDNFKKAGLQVLAEKERLLSEKRDAVLVIAGQIAVDQVVDGSEMKELKQSIEEFNRAKAEADNYLKFYKLTTSVVLPEELTLVVGEYWRNLGFFARDKGQVKDYFVRLTGRDVVVQDAFAPTNRGPLFVILLVITCLILVILLFKDKEKTVIFAFLAFVFCLMLFFL